MNATPDGTHASSREFQLVNDTPELDDSALAPATATAGAALCLSGGGYRAMIFHLGVLWRLNEAGWLPRIDRVSSVSGGSITAAVLGLHWPQLGFDATTGVAGSFVDEVVTPVRAMAHDTIDVESVIVGALVPFRSISDRVVSAYRKHLFDAATLQDLPEAPRFVINATNLESGVLMRFSRPYIADYRVGSIPNPTLPLAVAVAASSAFPPFLSPCTVDLRDATWQTQPGNDLTDEDFRGRIKCSDGGVYDNLGLQTAWSAAGLLLVSDAGGKMKEDSDPASDWGRHLLRVLAVVDNQVRSLRKRELIDAFQSHQKDGTYVGIRTHVTDYPVVDPMPAETGMTDDLAAIPTRLSDMDDRTQELLVNWGYVVTDAGMRSHVDPTLPRGTLPYPDRPLAGRL